MFLSRIQLDTSKRATMIALQNPSMFHGAIERAFEPRADRTLWRIDPLYSQHYLMLLSEDRPNLDGINAQFGTMAAPETRSYDGLLGRIQPGGRWHFRLCANPTYCKMQEGGRGKVCAHNTVQHQCEWLMEQSQKHGFSVSPDDFTVVNTHWYSFRKAAGNNVRLLSVTFEGLLTVTDEQLFRDALTQGIGRGKAYGMGMMTIVSVQGGG